MLCRVYLLNQVSHYHQVFLFQCSSTRHFPIPAIETKHWTLLHSIFWLCQATQWPSRDDARYLHAPVSATIVEVGYHNQWNENMACCAHVDPLWTNVCIHTLLLFSSISRRTVAMTWVDSGNSHLLIFPSRAQKYSKTHGNEISILWSCRCVTLMSLPAVAAVTLEKILHACGGDGWCEGCAIHLVHLFFRVGVE